MPPRFFPVTIRVPDRVNVTDDEIIAWINEALFDHHLGPDCAQRCDPAQFVASADSHPIAQGWINNIDREWVRRVEAKRAPSRPRRKK